MWLRAINATKLPQKYKLVTKQGTVNFRAANMTGDKAEHFTKLGTSKSNQHQAGRGAGMQTPATTLSQRRVSREFSNTRQIPKKGDASENSTYRIRPVLSGGTNELITPRPAPPPLKGISNRPLLFDQYHGRPWTRSRRPFLRFLKAKGPNITGCKTILSGPPI